MKLGLILAGPLQAPLPSTRVALLNILPQLQQAGMLTEVLHAPQACNETPMLPLSADAIAQSGIGVVIFQKVYGDSAVALAGKLEARGVRTVFMVCDRVVVEMAQATSATVCVTEYLANLYPVTLRPRIHVVHDGIERPEVRKATQRTDRGSAAKPLRAVLVTSARLDHIPVLGEPPPWLHIDVVGNYPARRAWFSRLRENWRAWHLEPQRRSQQLRLALSSRVTFHAWHPERVYQHLVQADVGIVPVDRVPQAEAGQPPPAWSVKSENRLTLKMSVGLPVVATPIPAYEPVVEQGRNAFLVATRGDWLDALEQLRDPARRIAMGQAARQSVNDRFSMHQQGQRLLGVLRQLEPSNP